MLEPIRTPAPFLMDGGEVGALMRAHDWMATPLGQPEGWPQPLKTLVGVMLASRQPMLIVWGPEHTTLYNDGYAAMCGARHPAALARPFNELWADIWDKVEPILVRALSGEAVHMDDIAFVMMRNGFPEETFFAFGYNPVRDETGQVAGMFCTCTETTARVQAERQANAALGRLRDLFEQAPGFMCVLRGPEHVFELVNASYQQLVGGRDLTGKSVREALPEVVDQGFFELLDRVYTTGEPFIGRGAPIMLQHGPDQKMTERFVDFVYQPIQDDEGDVTGIFVEGSDVTEAYLSTEALKSLTETLEQRVEERTHELQVAEEQLRQAQKMEAVGQLTGGLAHDFNNLLAGISGSLELMQTRMQQGRLTDVDRYMTVAQGAAKRAAALTHRLLAFSRRQTLDPKPTDVNRLTSGLQELIQRTVGPAVLVEVIGAANLWPVLVDPSQLENALLNLCINARDAMPDGGRITIETANKWLDERASRKLDMPEGQYLSLCVTDTGTGMPPEVVARVFEPFFTTKPIGEGTGLGLSMIYGFAQQSGGQVRIYSEVGQGTTVCIYLPRHYGEVAVEDPTAKLAMLPRSEQGETVLVVDDEPSVRMLVTDILEDLGYLAIEAGDSAAGLKVLQSDVRIDLLVTDVGLPGGMNGRQMADAARVSRPDLKVLFVTGYAENAILGNGYLAPGMAVLTKPFPVETMAARIRSMIEAKR